MAEQLPAHGPLGRRVVRGLQKQRRARVVDLRSFAASKQAAQRLVDSLGGDERFRGLAPAHAVYVYMQNHVSLLLEEFYWHEFIFQAYAGHALEAVYLTGLPDLRVSRPHGQAPPAEPREAARPIKLR